MANESDPEELREGLTRDIVALVRQITGDYETGIRTDASWNDLGLRTTADWIRFVQGVNRLSDGVAERVMVTRVQQLGSIGALVRFLVPETGE